MSAMTNPILEFAVGNRHAPACTALEINMLDIDASVDNVSVNTLATPVIIDILVEGLKSELDSMTYTS